MVSRASFSRRSRAAWSRAEGRNRKRDFSLQFSLPQHGEEVSPAASDLAMVLTRGLSLEHQKSSRDSLQYSSGYSTQTTTPSCSEDTIPSQGESAGGRPQRQVRVRPSQPVAHATGTAGTGQHTRALFFPLCVPPGWVGAQGAPGPQAHCFLCPQAPTMTATP